MKRLLPVGLMLLAGCGDDAAAPRATATASPTPSPPLTSTERDRLRRAEARIERHCLAVSGSLVDPAKAPTDAQEARAYAAADELVAIVRSKPRAQLGVGQDLRLYLGDVIENLEGANCDPRMRAHLERGLASIPR